MSTFIPLVVLRPPGRNLSFMNFAVSVFNAMDSAPSLFGSPTIPLATFQADIKAYQALLGTKGPVATAARKAALKKIKADLKHLRDYVQGVMELQTTLAGAKMVAESAGMSLQKARVFEKPELSAKNTGFTGTVTLDAKAVAPDTTYYWQFSSDGHTWQSAPETMKHITVIQGLTAGQTYYFRFRSLTRKGAQNWSQVVSLLVH